MSSPIVLLIIWAVFNILIKSSKDKKKAQDARRKSQQDPRGSSYKSATKRQEAPKKKNFRQTIEEYRDQIEKEFSMEAQNKKKPLVKDPPIKKQATLEENRKTFREGRYWQEEEAQVNLTPIEETEITSEVFFDVREDILKGIIYKEILDKPKSLQ